MSTVMRSSPPDAGPPNGPVAGPPERRAPDVASLERGQHQLRARRSPRWIAAGVLAICLGGIGAVLLYNGAVTSEQVLRVNAAVARVRWSRPATSDR